jgi:hypothetical protein
MKSTGAHRDVSPDVAEDLIANGLATSVKAEVAKPVPNLKFVATPGPIQGDFEYPPAVHHKCEACGTNGVTSSWKGTAHETRVFHCGITERVPSGVTEDYLRLFLKWKSKSKRKDGMDLRPPVTEKVSAAEEKRVKTAEEVAMSVKQELQSKINGMTVQQNPPAPKQSGLKSAVLADIKARTIVERK